MRSRAAAQLLLTALFALAGGAVHAFAPRPVTSGVTALPVSGLAVDFPAEPNTQYRLSSRWALTAHGASVDGRDIIDTLVGDTLVAGLWVQAGYFASDDCAAVVHTDTVKSAWDAEVTLHGATWAARGGVFTFEGALGERPMLVLCTKKSKDAPALVLYQTVAEGELRQLTQAQLTERAGASRLIGAVYAAYRDGRTAATYPTRDDAVRQPVATLDSPGAARKVHLAHTGLDLDLPDDGFVWVPDAAPPEPQTDVLYRLAPVLPDVSIEFGRFEAPSCAAHLAKNTTAVVQVSAPTGVPEGFTVGPTLDLAPGTELLLCKMVGGRALVLGVLAPAPMAELGPYAPVLAAIVRAAEGAPSPNLSGATPTTPATPATPARPVTPAAPDPVPHHGAQPLSDAVLGWLELEVPVSWRDETVANDGRAAPSPRVTFPVATIGALFTTKSGMLGRVSATAGVDLVSGLGADHAPTSSPRYGGQRWELLFDLGYMINVGGWGRFGLALGWHGLSGPITKNSSLAASLYALIAPEPDEFAFMLRVTPLQLMAANERMVLSPLVIESRVILGSFSAGLEGQWIDAPRPGDQDIPSKAFALLFRFGYGVSGR